MIAPNTVIDTLATKLWVGNKRLQGELGNAIKAHEENSFIDSGLRNKKSRKDSKVKRWKEGWVEEVESKFSSREIETFHEGKNVEIRTKNKFLIEHSREHVDAVKGSKEDIIKIDAVRKNKGVHLPCEVIDACGVNPTNGEGNESKASSISWTSKENAKRISDVKGNVISKGSYKMWNKFVAWLRWKKVKVMQDFKDECQWKWQYDEKKTRCM